MNEEMREVIAEFLTESKEGLDRLDSDLVELETDPSSSGALASVFRTMHTIKGTCGFLGFSRLEGIAHAAEDLLSLLRDGKLALNRTIIDALLASVDAVRAMLVSIEATGDEAPEEYTELRAWLGDLKTPEACVVESVVAVTTETVDATITPAVTVVGKSKSNRPKLARPKLEPPDPLDQPIPKKKAEPRSRRQLGVILKEKGFITDDALLLGMTEQSFGDTRPLGKILESLGIVNETQLLSALREQQVLDEDRHPTADATVRVDVQLLDSLMDLIGELVLARNQLVQLANDRRDAEYIVPAQRLNLITAELQAGVMKTRMQPIGSLWQRLPRVVRDLTVSLGKNVRIEVDGADTEVDRTVLEAIKDPLTHIVRNSVDHGIEMPSVRIEAGKDPEGTLRLRAYHEGGKVNIEIIDDGGGIDPAKIRAKAISSGTLTAEQAGRISDREILSCIFAPGFSTAAAVTNISGRGVGMDVVKTNIESIGGTVEIQSEVGRGTTMRIKIPLTLAIIPALVVLSGGQRYVIPQVNLVELVRLATGEMSHRIEMIHGAPVYRLRGRLLPIVDLSDMLLGGSGINIERSLHASQARSVNIVVLQTDGQAFGLIVDGVFDTQEIVVKPLAKQLRNTRVFAGATIMGDGKLSLILDIAGLARHAGVMKEQVDRPISSRGTALPTGPSAKSTNIVLAQVGTEQVAVPLANVARLERFRFEHIERSQGRSVVQYRNEILFLVDLASTLGLHESTGSTGSGASISVLVHTIGSQLIGVVVDAILDITDAEINRTDANGYVLGTAVIDGRVTSVIDTEALLHMQFSEVTNSGPAALYEMAV